MHIETDDKGRRELNFQSPAVKGILPEYFIASFPKFITLLNKYYEFLDENESTELMHHLLETRDITQVDLDLLHYIEHELLMGNRFLDRRSTAPFSSELLRAKGTQYSVQWFFRAFFNLDAEIIFPKADVFKLNDPLSGIGSESLKFLTDDKLYQVYAILVKVGVPISEWKDLYKVMVHPAGMYLAAKLLLVDVVDLNVLVGQPNPGISTIIWGSSETTPVASTEVTATGEIDIEYTPPVVYALTATPEAVNETTNKHVTFTISGAYIPNTPVYFCIGHVSTDSDDFVEDPNDPVPTLINRKSIPISNQTGTYTLEVATDEATEGTQTFNAYIYDQPYPFGTLLASAAVAINDTSLTPIAIPTYSIVVGNVTEGQSLSFTVIPEDANGETISWVLFGEDVEGRLPTKTGTETNITTTRAVVVPASTIDDKINGVSNGYITVTGANSGSQSTGSFQMLDAATEFVIELDPGSIVVEGNDIGFRVISKNSIDSTVTYSISNNASDDVLSRISSPTGTITGMDENTGNATSSLIQVGTTVNVTVQGDQVGTITVTGDTSGATASINFTMTDVSDIQYTISGPTSIIEPSS